MIIITRITPEQFKYITKGIWIAIAIMTIAGWMIR